MPARLESIGHDTLVPLNPQRPLRTLALLKFAHTP